MLAESLREWKTEARREGRAEGIAEIVLRQAERKLGPLDAGTRIRIEEADEETLFRWADRILTAQKISDVF